ncbi:cilia- and flagella-associated protein 53-like [Lycorma delicatula]|uniref:cilia- and flagella-associated protein 53-like n=1 Tax=Lycorma delicatula TaxID=130591 RepID=UPI003F515BFC
MFTHEFVAPTMPDPSGKHPRVRDITGPQYNTYGVIAKQPGSNWLHRKQLADKRRIENQRKEFLHKTKDFGESRRRRQFEEKTEKKQLISRLQFKVKQGLLAAEEDLEERRNMLRDMLLHEETAYTREYVVKAQSVQKEQYEELCNRLEELRLEKEAEKKKIVEEKRLQQFRLRCEDLRIKIFDYNRRHINEVHEEQMKEKLAKQEAEKELENMYFKIMQKNIESMKEHEEQIERERQQRVKEISEIYKMQMEGKHLLVEEEKRVKEEEAKLIEKLKEEMEKENREEKEEENKKRTKMREEMIQQVQQSRELLNERLKQEKDMELAFCKLIQYEIEREQAKKTDTKVQLRREMELFQSYVDEMKRGKEEEERKADDTRRREMEQIMKNYDDFLIQTEKAKIQLKKEVFKERDSQVQENLRRIEKENEMKKLEETLQKEELEKHKKYEEMIKKEREMKVKQYAKELKEQDEEYKRQKEKERQKEEMLYKEEIMKEEQYLQKLNIALKSDTCDRKHPFMKKLTGAAL